MFAAPLALAVASIGAVLFTGGLGLIPLYVIAIALWIWQVFDAHAAASAQPVRRRLWRPRPSRRR